MTKQKIKDSIIKNLNKKIDILSNAKIRIENGKDNFICFAICTAARNIRADEILANELRGYIMRQIKPYVNLDDWVRYKRSTLNRDKASMRSYRVQWIDWMIKQLQDQIDEVD